MNGYFRTTAEAIAWIERLRKWMPLVYRNDGLAAGWKKELERRQLNVDVWQITIDGKLPTQLPGSQDAAIVVSK